VFPPRGCGLSLTIQYTMPRKSLNCVLKRIPSSASVFEAVLVDLGPSDGTHSHPKQYLRACASQEGPLLMLIGYTCVQALGIMDAKAELQAIVMPCQLQNVPKRIVRKPRAPVEDGEVRRSSRDRPKVPNSPLTAEAAPTTRTCDPVMAYHLHLNHCRAPSLRRAKHP